MDSRKLQKIPEGIAAKEARTIRDGRRVIRSMRALLKPAAHGVHIGNIQTDVASILLVDIPGEKVDLKTTRTGREPH